MFETATLSHGPSPKRVLATCMGFTGQALLVSCALLAPLISPQTLGRAVQVTALAPPGTPPPPPAPAELRVVPRTAHATTQFLDNILRAPMRVPERALAIEDPPEAAAGGPSVAGAIGNGREGGAPGGILDSIISQGTRAALVRPPEITRSEPVKAAPEPVRPPRVTALRLATPIRKVEPVYPPLARQARVSGTVELLGVLGTDGRIHELKVVRGHPLLIKAAMDAVRQWVFEPTLLNGIAVEVAAPVIVNFILN